VIREMRIRNYSNCTILTYSKRLDLLSVYYGKSPDQLTTEEVKDYIYHRMTAENISVSLE
jgi:hypothetical protein